LFLDFARKIAGKLGMPQSQRPVEESMTSQLRDRLEYVLVAATPGIGVAVTHTTPEIEPIAEQAMCQGVIWIVNQLAGLGFRLLEGTVLRTSANACSVDGAFFMCRERRDE